MKRSALVVGATGLVGSHLVERLLQDPAYARVRVLARRPLALAHPRLDVVVDALDRIEALGEALAVDDVFCCLGTTIAKAGSREAFAAVDEHLVVALARASRAAGAQQFIVISAVGASEHALSFYSRVKGRMERAVAAIGFDAVHIVRPSLLLGDRAEHRAGEALAIRWAPRVDFMLRGALQRYRPVRSEDVAEAMVRLALRGEHGVHVHHLPLADDDTSEEADTAA